MRVLISAYACNPEFGSELGVGWAWAAAAARVHDVTLVTSPTGQRRAIGAALERMPEARMRVDYVAVPSWGVPGWKYRKRFRRAHYLVWQGLAWQRMKALLASQPFDVVHHVTYSADWLPAAAGYVSGDVPYIWGPVGGATGVPRAGWRYLSTRGKAEEAIREVATRLMRAMFGRSQARRASIVLAQNPDVVTALGRDARRIVLQPNVAVDPTVAAGSDPPDWFDDVRRRHTKLALYAGRLLELKGLAIALHALARSSTEEWGFLIVGEGRDEQRLRRMARSLGLDRRIHFASPIPREEVLVMLSRVDAVLLPSLHDAAPGLAAEAVLAGCPVVHLRHGGLPVIVAGQGFGGVDPEAGDLAAAVAEALGSVGHVEPSSRWSSTRLPPLIDSLYTRAVRGD